KPGSPGEAPSGTTGDTGARPRSGVRPGRGVAGVGLPVSGSVAARAAAGAVAVRTAIARARRARAARLVAPRVRREKRLRSMLRLLRLLAGAKRTGRRPGPSVRRGRWPRGHPLGATAG